jgi:ubiquinone/menaquinone biosynthesis C-methylase UbiE
MIIAMNNNTQNNAAAYDAQATNWKDVMDVNVGHKYLEKPAMYSQLPQTLENKRVLSVGVGSGEELTEIKNRNPIAVTAIDISEKLMAIAKTQHPDVAFEKMDMSHMTFADRSFDLIYSSLTFHYAPDWDVLLSEMYRVLIPGGTLLFSTHNPPYWDLKQKTGNVYTNARGVSMNEHRKVINDVVDITYYNHLSVEALRETVEHAGFTIEAMITPTVQPICENPAVEEQREYEDLVIKNERIPLFVIVRAAKKA